MRGSKLTVQRHTLTSSPSLDVSPKLGKAHHQLARGVLRGDVFLLETDTLHSQDWDFPLVQETTLIDSPSSSETRPCSTTSLSSLANGSMQLVKRPFPCMVRPDGNMLSESKIANSCQDPEDNEVAFSIANLAREDARHAIEAAHAAFKTYKKVPHRERRWLMQKWSDLLKANMEDLAAICTLELGKPYTESFVTVKYATDFLDWFEGEIERTYGETIPAARGDNRIFTIREPQGVVAANTPWKSPIAMVTRKIEAAIAAGNTVVLKPAPETPLCAIAAAKLFERAGYPPGVLNVVTSDLKHTPEIGDEFCHNSAVRHLSFTGSTAVGKMLNSECGKSLKKTSMELGGNAPFIVFEDANLEKAVNGESSHSL
jgi:acyl-CoA reductase-like NAD-dependent aldehyde dehydrogenase